MIPSADGLETGSGADRSCDFAGLFGGEEEFDQTKAEVEGGAGTAGSEEIAIEDDTFVGEEVGQLVCDGRVCGVAAVGEKAGVVKDGGCGTDRGHEATGGMMAENDRANARIGAEVFGAGAAGEEDRVEVVRFDGGERGVGVKDEIGAAAGDVNGVAEGGEGDVGAGAAQEIDRGDSLDFLKSLREDCENGGHAMS